MATPYKIKLWHFRAWCFKIGLGLFDRESTNLDDEYQVARVSRVEHYAAHAAAEEPIFHGDEWINPQAIARFAAAYSTAQQPVSRLVVESWWMHRRDNILDMASAVRQAMAGRRCRDRKQEIAR